MADTANNIEGGGSTFSASGYTYKVGKQGGLLRKSKTSNKWYSVDKKSCSKDVRDTFAAMAAQLNVTARARVAGGAKGRKRKSSKRRSSKRKSGKGRKRRSSKRRSSKRRLSAGGRRRKRKSSKRKSAAKGKGRKRKSSKRKSRKSGRKRRRKSKAADDC